MLRSSNHRAVSAYVSGAAYLNANSSSSFLTLYMPRSFARGANTSRVSLAIFTLFSGLSAPSVRMLCSLSASLTMMTRTSWVIARNISFRSSACTFAAAASACSGVGVAAIGPIGPIARPDAPPAVLAAACVPCLLTELLTLLTLVSPSTIRRTAGPNLVWMDSNVTYSVSSTVS